MNMMSAWLVPDTCLASSPLCVSSSAAKGPDRRLRPKLAGRALAGVCALMLLPGAFSIPARAQSVTFAGLQTTVAGGGRGNPTFAAVDGAGDVFIVDHGSYQVIEVAPNGAQTTVPTSGLNNPNGIALDKAGDVFVADVENNRVVEVPYLGNGSYGTQTTVPATGLKHPYGVGLDAAGDLFIADTGNGRVVELPNLGNGTYGTQTQVPVSGLAAPFGVALDGAGDVFIADFANTYIVEVPYLGGGNYGTQVAIGSGMGGPPIGGPEGVAVDENGDVFAADTNNSRVLEIPYLGNGNYGAQFTVGSGLNQPTGVAVDGQGDVFIVDNGNDRTVEVQRIAANFGDVAVGSNSTLTLNYNITANDNTNVVIYSASVVTQGAAGLDFTDVADNCVTSYFSSATCSIEVQFAPGAPGLRQGAVQFGTNIGTITTLLRGVGEAPAVAFPGGPEVTVNNGWYPNGIATDAAGNVYMSAYPGAGLTGYVIVIPPGCNNSSCYKQWGSGWIAPSELAVDGAGNIYLPDVYPSASYIVPPGCTSSSCETTVGSGISSPSAVALDGAGDIYIGSVFNGGSLYELPVLGNQTTVGSGVDSVTGVALDDRGDIFITSFVRGTTLEVPSVGTQTTFASWLGESSAVTTDAAGDVYIATGSAVTEIPAGCGSSACDITLPGSYGYVGGLALDNSGNLFIPDGNNGPLYEVQRSQGPTLSFGSIQVNSTSSPMTVAIQNIGNQPLTFSNFAASTNFTVDSGSTTCSTSSPLAVGAICNVGVDFSPTTSGPLSGTLTLTDNALNASAATQTISLSGTGSPVLYALTTSASPSAGGTVTAGGSYAANTLVPLTATPNAGYIFSGWTASAGSFSNANSATTNFTMPAQAASVTANFALITAAPAITSAGSTTFSLGFPGSFAVTATGIPTPALSENGTLPSGVTFLDNGNGTATLSGTATQAGTFGITITANNAVPPNFNQSFTLTVNQATPSIAVTSVSPSSEVYGQDAVSTITAVLSWFGSGTTPTASDVSIATNAPGGALGATSCTAPVGANSVIATVPVGTRPVGIAYDPNNGNVYVANGTAASVSVVSGSTNTVVATIPVGVGPRAITFDPSNSDLYVANRVDGTVSVIDGSTNTVVATVPVGNEPQAITLDPNNGDLYVANLTDGTVSVINGSTNTVVATVPVGSTPIGIVFDPNNGDLYVTNDNSPGTVSVIGGSTNTVVATVSVANSPYSMAFDPNNGDVYVAGNTGPGFDQVSVINGSTNAVVATLTVPAGSSAVAFDANNGNVYVANFGYSPHPNGTVSVISGSSNTVVTTIPVGNGAIGISIDPSNGDLYVTNSGDGTVSVIDGSSNTVIATVPVGASPEAIAFDPNNGDMYVANNTGASVSVLSPSATATCTAAFTPDANTVAGTYTMSASFSGDPNYTGSSSSQSNNFSITGTTSSTSVTSGQNPSNSGQSVTFVATVGGEYGQVKAGKQRRHTPNSVGATVSWSANTGCSSTAVSTLPAQVSCTTSILPVGTPTVTATYSGDVDHTGSSGSFVQTVNQATVNVTVGTNISGLAFTVDGNNYTGPANFTWNIGDQHTIATTSPQTPSAGTQETFASWSDSGDISHQVTATAGVTNYTASFNTSYLLTTASNPPGGGTVSPASGTYYAANAVVNLNAIPNTNYTFTNWTGNVANANSASTTVTMTGPQTVTANYVALQLRISKSTLDFGTVYLNNTYHELPVTITNVGTSTITVTGVSIVPGTADASAYKIVEYCKGQIKPKQVCVVAVDFLADAVGTLTATLDIADTAAGSPQQVSLTANVIDPVAELSPKPLMFGQHPVSSQTTLPVQLTNSGQTDLTIGNVAIGGADAGDYSQSNNCPSTLAPTAGCTIEVTFTPSAKGGRGATLTVSGNMATGKAAMELSGIGH